MKSLKIAVVGAGPVGSVIAESFLELNLHVDVIDPWQNPLGKFTITEHPKLIENLAKKSKFGSTKMYEYPSNLIERNKEAALPLSSTLGGLTTVWGANIWKPTVLQLGLHATMADDFENAYQWLQQRISIMGSRKTAEILKFEKISEIPASERFKKIVNTSYKQNSNFHLDYAILAVNEKSCIRCGKCLEGCPEDSIYSAQDVWQKLQKNPNLNVIKGLVLKIQTNKVIIYQHESEIHEAGPYDYIFLSTGAIPSTNILQRSSLIPREVSLDDTQVYYLPIFTRFQASKEKTRFTLAQIFYRETNSKKAENTHISIYETSENLRNRGKQKLGILAKFIPKLFWNHLIAGIGFIDPRFSGQLKIQFHSNKSFVTFIKNKNTKKIIRRVSRRTRNNLISKSLYPILSLIQIPNIGASYHVGTLRNLNGDFLLSEDGEIKFMNHLYVVDSSALRQLPIGPITFPAMANARRIANKVITEILK
jgi:NAD-dependent dihydropyrimidine dehydrogenase PreA subunit